MRKRARRTRKSHGTCRANARLTEHRFHQFFNHIDTYQQSRFLYLPSKGYEATLTGRKDGAGPAVEAKSA